MKYGESVYVQAVPYEAAWKDARKRKKLPCLGDQGRAAARKQQRQIWAQPACPGKISRPRLPSKPAYWPQMR